MEPTVQVGDHVVVSKLAYDLRVPFSHVRIVTFDAPARGDVVVLESPEDGTVLLKRVVAVPGDLVLVRGGRVFFDHETRLAGSGDVELGPVRVPAERFLVLGDNRDNSHDGRAFGFVSRRAILGRASAVIARSGRLCWLRLGP